ncbi:hypothetical protein P0D75_39715 [Paraburkholderia sediminicola]|uniref:hypothetical protein n=1 Tax=Paraburkholderia sediminicola TaxID=458836 RepID=UPI0038B9C202
MLPREAAKTLAEYLAHPGVGYVPSIEDDDWLVVISQTCDVVALTLKAEPFVEILHCRVPEGGKVRSQYAKFRSTRVIDFRPNRSQHASLVLSAHATADRYLVPRQVLVDLNPDPERRLDDTAVQRLAAWYALRSSRPAWPDNFVTRISKETKEQLETIVSDLGDDLEVRVGIAQRSEELPAESSYTVAVWFIVDAIVWQSDAAVRSACTKSYGEFTGKLASCAGIEIDTDFGSVVPGDEFTWQQRESTDEWNFANLSHAE